MFAKFEGCECGNGIAPEHRKRDVRGQFSQLPGVTAPHGCGPCPEMVRLAQHDWVTRDQLHLKQALTLCYLQFEVCVDDRETGRVAGQVPSFFAIGDRFNVRVKIIDIKKVAETSC